MRSLSLVSGIFLLFHLCGTLSEHKVQIPIAGLFTEDQSEQEVAFRYAVDRINMDRNILPKARLIPKIERIPPWDSMEAGRKVCNLSTMGIAAVFGPQDMMSTGIVKSICETLEIPHLQSHWELNKETISSWSIKMYPEPKTLSQGLADVIQDMGWKSFTVLYENEESLIRLQGVLKLRGPNDPPITIRQLDQDDDHRTLLKDVQMSGENHIILHCDPRRVMTVLRQAKEVKMMEDYQNYVITDLDTHTIDFQEFKLGRTNITSIRIIDPNGLNVQNAVRDWVEGERRNGRLLDITPQTVKTETALLYDSVYQFAKAMNILDSPKNRIIAKPLSCDQVDKWISGYSLVNYMKVVEQYGLSGPIRFNKDDGRRDFFQLEIVELSRTGFKKIGTWDPINKVNYTRTAAEMESQVAEKLENKTFMVVSRIGRPYLMHSKDYESKMGNARFEGYAINLIDEIAKELNFKYEFYLAPDGKYGSYNPVTKKWDGLVKELLERKADLAICDLTITYDRKNAVDFTMPFMTLGISILYTKPAKSPANLFSFLSPFSLDVWMYMCTAYLGVSLLLFFLARTTPFEWENPHPCNSNCEELENNFCLVNCLWFSLGSLMGQGCDILPKISPYEWAKPHPCKDEVEEMETNMNLHNSIWHNCGSLMQQGSDIAPKAVSTRIVAGMWWFFSLIMISSYTANLAAFLTIDRMEIEIKSAEELAKQSKIKYGTVADAATMSYIKNSNFSTYQKMWAAMESARPSVFTSSNSEGVERVLKSKRTYAFIMESTGIEYEVERHCELQQIGGLLDSKGYGIAMPMNSPYRTAISGAVLKMQEDGRLHMLKEKWWKQMYVEPGKCQGDESASDASAAELGLANVGGVFVVLALGCVAALLMAILEFVWNIRKIAVEEEITPKEALVRELKFALACSATTKPVRKKKSSSKSSQESAASSMQLDNFDREQYELAKK